MHNTPMPQETLRKWIQTGRPQATTFGRVDDNPKNNTEILINFNLVFIDFDWVGASLF
jgi:hypothetical protein